MGIGESLAEDKIKHLLASTNPTIGTYAKNDGIHLRLTAKAQTEAEARAAIVPMEEKLKAILGQYIYGYDRDTPATVVGDLLLAHGLSIAIMETCTGGYVSSTLMEDLRYPSFCRGAYITPTLEAMVERGVPLAIASEHGIGSLEAAQAMATAARNQFCAGIGLGVTGSIGEAGSGAATGTIHTAIDDGEIHTSSMNFANIPAEIKRWAMLTALNLVRSSLSGSS